MEKIEDALTVAGGPVAPEGKTPSCLERNLRCIRQVLGLAETAAGDNGPASADAPLMRDLAPFLSLLEAWPLSVRAFPGQDGGLHLVTAMLDAGAALCPAEPEKRWRASALKSLEAIVSGGQGAGRTAALQSCLGEMAERLSLLSRGLEDPLVHVQDQGLADLAAGPVLRFSPLQEQALIRSHPRLAQLWTGTSINWNALSPRRLRAEPLGGGEPVQVPAFGQLVGEGIWSGLPGLPLASSVGAAVWGEREGACRRALAEAGERDAVGLWWYNRLGITPLSEGVAQEVLPNICARWIAERGRVTRFFLLPSDLAQHVVMALSWTGDGQRGVGGFAAGPDAAAALSSALMELVQGERMLDLRLSALSDRTSSLADLPPALDLALNRDIRAVFRLPGEGDAALRNLPPALAPDALASSLLDQGRRVYVLDLSRPDIGLACAKVVSPDLVDWQPRFGSWRFTGATMPGSGLEDVEREKELSSRPFPF